MLSKMKHSSIFPEEKTLGKFRAQFIRLSTLKEGLISKFMCVALFISYTQIFFQVIQIAEIYLQNDQSQSETIFEKIKSFFIFDSMFAYDQHDSNLVLFCCGALSYFILSLICFLTAAHESFKPKQRSFLLTKIWAFLVHLHGPIFFFPINNICNRLQKETWIETGQIAIYNNNTIIFCCSILIYFINILFAGLPYIFLFDVLPGPNSLASKNFYVDQINLYQKLLLSLAIGFLPENFIAYGCILCFANLVSIIRYYFFQNTLPRYNFKTLLLDLHLINICSLVALLALIFFGINQLSAYQINIQIFFEVLFVLSILSVINTQMVFKKIIYELILNPFEKLNPSKALHKILLLKFLQTSMRSFNKCLKQIDIYYFYFWMITTNQQKIFGIKADSLNVANKDVKKKYLEFLMAHYTENQEIKLFLSRFYFKNLDLPISGINTLNKIKYGSFNVQASLILLKSQIQENILEKSKTINQSLNLHEYFTVAKHKENIKEQIKSQLDSLNSFWKEYCKDNPDILKLQNLAEIFNTKKRNMHRRWDHIEKEMSNSSIYLWPLYGNYEYLLNDSYFKGKEFFRKYHAFVRKHNQKRIFNLWNLTDKKNFNVTIRTNTNAIGVILDCSAKIKNSLGYEKEEILGSNIGALMSPNISERHNTFIQDYIDTGRSVLLGRMQSTFVKNKSGSLQKVSLLTSMYPFFQQEILLTGLFRLVSNPNEYIILTSQGEIDSCTSRIASKLDIHAKKVHISTICQNPEMISENCNLSDLNQNEKINSATSKDIDPLQGTSQCYVSMLAPASKEELKPKEKILICKLTFNPYNPDSKNANSTFSYYCEVRTINFKDGSFIVIIEIKMDKEEVNFRPCSSNMNIFGIKDEINCTEDYGNSEYRSRETKELLSPKKIYFKKKKEDFSSYFEKEKTALSFANADTQRQDFLGTEGRMLSNEGLLKSSSNENKKFQDRKNITMTSHDDIGYLMDNSSDPRKEKKEKCIEEAYKVQYYPKFVTICLSVLLLIFVSLLILELYVQFKANQDLKNSKALAKTLDLAGLRVDTFAQIGRGARSGYYLQTGMLVKDKNAEKITINSFVTNFQANIEPLKDTNNKLQQAIQDIDKIFQEKFKETNIRIYDIKSDLTLGSYRIFNTFDAMNVLIEKLLKVQNNYQKTKGFILEDLIYVIVNCLNDILESAINSNSLILDSIHYLFQNITVSLQICLIMCLCLLNTGIIVIILLLYKIYASELTLIQQFFRIDIQDVQTIRNRLSRLESVLQDEDFETSNEVAIEDDYTQKRNIIDAEKQNSKWKSKNLKTRSFKMFYWKKIGLCLFIFLTYNLELFFTFQEMFNKINLLTTKINGSAKAQSILYEASVLVFNIGQIVSGDTVRTLKNRPVEEQLQKNLKNFLQSGYELLESFKNKNGQYDPFITPFFFEDCCRFIPASSSVKPQCLTIANGAKDFTFLSLFSRHYAIINDIYYKFLLSDKSFSSLSNLVVSYVLDIVPSNLTIRKLMQVMIEQIQISLSETWDMTKMSTNVLLTICPLLLLMISLFAWKYILKHFIEYINRFKRMMRLVPFGIISRTPTLNGVLMTSSKGKLRKMKYDN